MKNEKRHGEEGIRNIKEDIIKDVEFDLKKEMLKRDKDYILPKHKINEKNSELLDAMAHSVHILTQNETAILLQPTTKIFEIVTRRFKKRDHKVGVLLGFKEGDRVLIGWSKANLKAGDVFDKEKGLELAALRAMNLAAFPPTPPCFVRKLNRFTARCVRYFKDAKAINLVR